MPGQPMPGQPMPGQMPGQPMGQMPGQPMGQMPGQPMPGQPMAGQMPGQPMGGMPGMQMAAAGMAMGGVPGQSRPRAPEGFLNRYFRIFTFVGQVLKMAMSKPILFAPIVFNIGVAVPVNIALAIVYMMVSGQPGLLGLIAHAVLLLGITALYFIDYFAGGLAVSLIHDQVTTQNAKLGPAIGRTLRASPGILIFATVSAILDLLSSYAQERDDIIGTIILQILRVIWTTATYVVMPAMVIDRLGFFKAFKRSKDLMKQDPTQVGVGIVGLGFITYIMSLVIIGGGTFLAYNVLYGIPLLAALVLFTSTNVYWALSGYLKSSYYTCFYLWARECERNQRSDPALAPAPLQATVANAFA